MADAVLDSFALLALVFDEQGADLVAHALERSLASGREASVAAPNWAEVRYMIERRLGAPRWDEIRQKLLGLPIDIVPADVHLAEAAGELKASRRMSLADCFAAALAIRERASLYTGDPEFRAVEKDVDVVWIAGPPASSGRRRSRP